MQYGTNLKFAGFVVSDKGVTADPDKVAAIRDFPAPKNVTEVCSFLGLVQQLSHFTPDLAHMTVAIRSLLKKNIAFNWLPVHDNEFITVKSSLCSPVLVEPFDPTLPTELLTDASKLYCIGFALIQRELHNRARLILCSSRALTSAQSRYAAIELECMAVQWAVSKCEYFLKGIPHFTVVTDHKPLLGIFDKHLHDLPNIRLCLLYTSPSPRD